MKLKMWFEQHPEITQAAFGKSLNPPVSQGMVWQWISGKRPIAPKHAKSIVQVTDGEVTAHDCAPGIYHEGFEFPEEPAREAAA